MSQTRRELLDEVVGWVRSAGELCLAHLASGSSDVDTKSDGSPVTAADRGAERLLRERIHARFPEDTVRGEEEPEARGRSGRTWWIDPIDGTKSFVRGVPLFTNLLALDDEDGPLLGVVHVPMLGQTIYAARGEGAFENGRRVRVSERRELAGSLLTTTGFEIWPVEALAEAQRAGLLLRTWGDGYGYALVATGRAEAMVDPVIAPWDIAPMPILLSEAGGRFTDLRGGSGIHAGSGIATNGLLHDDLLKVLASMT